MALDLPGVLSQFPTNLVYQWHDIPLQLCQSFIKLYFELIRTMIQGNKDFSSSITIGTSNSGLVKPYSLSMDASQDETLPFLVFFLDLFLSHQQ